MSAVIVTGGSRGIGAAIVVEAARAGYSVVFTYRENDSAARAVVEKAESFGAGCVCVKADSRSESDLTKAFEEAAMNFGTIVGLVSNAAITGQVGSLSELDIDSFENTIRSNLTSVVIGMKLAERYMSKSLGGSGGAIVNISSQAAEFGGNGLYAYSASKSAVNSITRAAARELAAVGIRVNAVSPGIIDTEMHGNMSLKKLREIERGLPFSRLGEPEEVAKVVLWLLSDSASYLSGAVVPVTGAR